MELTTETIIKIIIGVLVIVVVVFAIYASMKSYVIPYFAGIGFEEPKMDPTSDFYKQLVKPENLIATTTRTKDNFDFIIDNGKNTNIYFYKQMLYLKEMSGADLVGEWIGDKINLDEPIGTMDKEGKLTLETGYEYSNVLTNSYRVGNEIYRMK